MSEFERPRSLTAVVTDHIRTMIVRGDVALGAALSERSIAADLKVSKTPVREALAQLRQEGLVNIFPQSGVRVFTLSAREVREICVFRRTLEAAALSLSMKGYRKRLHTRLAAIVREMDEVQARGDIKAYLALDTDFHLAFFDYCDNSFLRNSYNLYAGKIAALRTHLADKPQHTSLSLEEHHDILRAIANGEDDKLAQLLDRHIGRTQETYEIGIEDIAAADAARLNREPAPRD